MREVCASYAGFLTAPNSFFKGGGFDGLRDTQAAQLNHATPVPVWSIMLLGTVYAANVLLHPHRALADNLDSRLYIES